MPPTGAAFRQLVRHVPRSLLKGKVGCSGPATGIVIATMLKCTVIVVSWPVRRAWHLQRRVLHLPLSWSVVVIFKYRHPSVTPLCNSLRAEVRLQKKVSTTKAGALAVERQTACAVFDFQLAGVEFHLQQDGCSVF